MAHFVTKICACVKGCIVTFFCRSVKFLYTKYGDPCIGQCFSEAGICEILKSDNGSSINSHHFKDFAKQTGFRHRKIIQLWPQPNAEYEQMMKTIGKAIRDSHVHLSNWKQGMYAFLRS